MRFLLEFTQGLAGNSAYHMKGKSPYHVMGKTAYHVVGKTPYRNQGNSPYHTLGNSSYHAHIDIKYDMSYASENTRNHICNHTSASDTPDQFHCINTVLEQ